jgi:hypothetical protein
MAWHVLRLQMEEIATRYGGYLQNTLRHVDALLGNHWEISSYTTAIAR